MSNNADLFLANTISIGMKFLRANLSDDFFVSTTGDEVASKGTNWAYTLSFGVVDSEVGIPGHAVTLGMKVFIDSETKQDKVTMSIVWIDIEAEEEVRKQLNYLPPDVFATAYGRDFNEIWKIEKPIDIIAFFKTFNQLSLDLGYRPLS